MPVTVFTNSPIAAKPSGVTPKTDSPDTHQSGAAAPPPATTTASATSSPGSSYPPAQPGAAPSLPTATAAAQAQAYYTPQPQPTPTSAVSSEGPPPPQPGAVPIAPGAAARSAIPPPPKVGEKYQPPAGTTPYPPQMSIPAPTAAYPAQQYGTLTAAGLSPATPAGGYGGGSGSGGGRNLQHPPGYQQSASAANSGLDRYQTSSAPQGSTYSPAAFAADSEQGRQQHHQQSSGDEEGVWDTAKKWAQATGQKLAEAESEVWKRINKD